MSFTVLVCCIYMDVFLGIFMHISVCMVCVCVRVLETGMQTGLWDAPIGFRFWTQIRVPS